MELTPFNYNAIVQDSATRNPANQRFNEAVDIDALPVLFVCACYMQR